jgi:hypothetical protein
MGKPTRPIYERFMEKIAVKCKVKNGMFPNESFITINTGYGDVQSLVAKELIQNGEIELSIDAEIGDELFVIIPGEVTKGQRLVRLKRPDRTRQTHLRLKR